MCMHGNWMPGTRRSRCCPWLEKAAGRRGNSQGHAPHVRRWEVGLPRSTEEGSEPRGKPAEELEGRRWIQENAMNRQTDRAQYRTTVYTAFRACVRPSTGDTPTSEIRAVCVSSARTDLCGGRWVTVVPTATGRLAIGLGEQRAKGRQAGGQPAAGCHPTPIRQGGPQADSSPFPCLTC